MKLKHGDLSQEAFIKAWRALPNFKLDAAFYTWLPASPTTSPTTGCAKEDRKRRRIR
ncbi:MAG: hypothetical protein IPK32_16850 [Verrucomicrobiaceae bacterium]|nr:hypothetical protein [Verrucomicrobiaceae bacterium]